MLTGPIVNKKCTKYSVLVEETIISGSMFGAKYGKDSKRVASMLPDESRIVKYLH